MNLNTLWFLIIGFVLTIYVILDGLDLGIGIILLFTPKDKYKNREQLIEIIGPHWNGNEVWLLVFGGMLFAIFPKVYAALLSGMYLPFIILLIVFIVRGISIPLRNRYDNNLWHNFWDLCLGISSLSIAFLFGAVVAILIQGLGINQNGFIKLNLQKVITPFSLWVGITSVTLLCLHGAIYAGRKSKEELNSFCLKTTSTSWILMLVFSIPTEIIILKNEASNIFENHLLLYLLFLILFIGAIIYIPLALKKQSFNKAFLASSLIIVHFTALLYMYSYPNLLRSTEVTDNLTIYNASVSTSSMIVMLILTAIAMPIVICYTIYTHIILDQ